MNRETLDTLVGKFRSHFGRAPAVAAFAPGRIEVLGNHTDYNEGYVLSAAIDLGMFCCAAPAPGPVARLVAGDLMEETRFPVGAPTASPPTWSNYVKGVFAQLFGGAPPATAFDAMFFGDIPVGAGLSSSAALEMSSGLALLRLYGREVPALALARAGQTAEHTFVGVKCGLLDQVTSLSGRAGHLVMTDFRTLGTELVPLGDGLAFLVCDTGVRHRLVDSDYNERRARCREAADFFASCLPHPVRALRDVSMAEWQAHAARMDPTAAKRAAHVVGEDERVVEGRSLLGRHALREFGRLMFASHESSVRNFENSCRELDFLVETARGTDGVLGARLTGGGFGGSALLLVHAASAPAVSAAVSARYAAAFGRPCRITRVLPSDGARVIE